MERHVIAVCGKGGVGKTAFSSILSRVLIEANIRPLLLIDADPAGGLGMAIGESPINTLGGVRDQLIASARKGETAEAANQLDYLLLQALMERKDYSLLAMGRSTEKGCFCPANQLLKASIDVLVSSFVAVLIDAEAGIEQINRDVTHRVSRIVTVLDGSKKSIETLHIIRNMVPSTTPISVVANRGPLQNSKDLPAGTALVGAVPENEVLRQFDRAGRPLWELPHKNQAVVAVRRIASRLGLFKDDVPDSV
jgi:CO dehydrogenase maturation factor